MRHEMRGRLEPERTHEACYGLLAEHDLHLQQLLHGREADSRRWLAAQPEDSPLAHWIAAGLKSANGPVAGDLPASVAGQWRGWRSYYDGRHQQAAEHFSEAWRAACDEDDRYYQQGEIALGLGKVYTRTGHWRAAREWLLHGLFKARRQERIFSVIRGYGALAEIFLRGGQPQAAFNCFSTAYHLLPPGSGQRSRQLNYLASALLRNGVDVLRVETLLMTSLFLGRDHGDDESVWHSLARLQWMDLSQTDKRARDVALVMHHDVPQRECPVPCGFLQAGRARMLVRQGRHELAGQALAKAVTLFDGHAPFEHAWVSMMCDALQGQGATERLPTALMQLEPLRAPETHSVLDSTWRQLALPQVNGFAALSAAAGDFERLADLQRLFFL